MGKGLGSLDEIMNRWAIEDVMDAHEYLDIQEDLEVLQANAMADNARRRGR